ncbi:hypothetical protein BHYA_0009g00280 [Botrytis hyacinthi]|uniref:Fungal STAND N-terminal Goodbye domain-containing protein n=1 Tax=Botrytis hyacinthi TaxID=278943 RepID=A0A4Z1H242_9HELO|nr:hypothetical protein BHYA_0009g00280 [Botrytis hyacinthi]
MGHQTERHTITADSPTVDLELQKLWDEAQNEFHKNTNRKLASFPPRKIEDVLAQLKEKFQPEDGVEPSTKHKIKDAIGKILECIQFLGGLAAEAASTVFAPAKLCFNAISFLIEVPHKVAEVYEGLGNLFEEITHAMALLNVYRDYKKLDRELKNGIHKIMVSIVRICGLSINIIDGGKKARVKAILKVTFLKDDSGVKDELRNFKELIARQNDLTGVITLKTVLDNSAGIDKILKRQDSFSEKQSHISDEVAYVKDGIKAQKDEKIISDRIPQGLAKANAANEELKNLRKRFPQDGFKWLSKVGDYEKWLGLSSGSAPRSSPRLLFVSGEFKTGKSCLVASIEEDLRSKKIANLAIAYHAFTGIDSKSTKTTLKDDVVYALKSMALQLATQNKMYATSLSQLKEKDLRITDERENSAESQWWDKLRFSKDLENDEPLNIVLLLDGLDQLSEGNANKFLELLRKRRSSLAKENGLQIRILVTGITSPGFSNLHIRITEHTKDDIKSFIEQELNKLNTLQGQDVEMKRLRQLIREELPKVANGSFSVIIQKLTRITEAVRSDAYSNDIEAILDQNPSEDPDEMAQKIIADLNTSLSTRDIRQLNEILDWAIFGYKYFSIGQIKAALWLSSGKLPVQPLERKLKERFGKVFSDMERDTVRVYGPIGSLFKDSDSSVALMGKTSAYAIETASISMTVSIHRADLYSVQRFFWDLTEKTGIGKFDFSPSNSDNENKIKINPTQIQAHCHITEQLLKLLNEEPNDKTEPLVDYALKYLPNHIGEVKKALLLDRGKIEGHTIQVVAKRLVDLLSDVEAIEKFWHTTENMHEYWWDPESVKIIRDFIKDENIIVQLEPRERRWVKEHTRAEEKADFYRPITLMVAKKWLRDPSRTCNPYQAYKWVDSFVDMEILNADCINDTEIDDSRSESTTEVKLNTEEDPECRKILSRATWARKALNMGEDSLWYERIGQTFFQAGKFKKAIEYFDKAKSLPSCHWTVHEFQALSYASLSELTDKFWMNCASSEMGLAITALKSMQIEKKLLQDMRGDPPAENVNLSEALVRTLTKFASWQKKVGKIDRAIARYKEILEINPQEHRIRSGLVEILCNEGKDDEASSVIFELKDWILDSQQQPDIRMFSEFLLDIAKNLDDSDPIHSQNHLDFVINLARSNTVWSELVLEALVRAATSAENELDRAVLLVYQGLLIAGNNETNVEQFQRALMLWNDCRRVLNLSSNQSSTHKWHLAIVKYQIMAHFQLAIKTRQNNPHLLNEQQLIYALEAERNDSPIEHTWLWRALLGTFITPLLASYYSQFKDFAKARNLLRDDMVAGISILEDDDPVNDVIGFRSLAWVFAHTGDDQNALSVWSLVRPTEDDGDSEEEHSFEGTRNGPINLSCGGACGKQWTYADDFYVCKTCDEGTFCSNCLEELKRNRLARWNCRPEHSWLHVPPWNDEDVAGEGMVRVMDESNSPKEVKISDWIKDLKRIWEIE